MKLFCYGYSCFGTLYLFRPIHKICYPKYVIMIKYFVDWSEEVQSTETAVTITE